MGTDSEAVSAVLDSAVYNISLFVRMGLFEYPCHPYLSSKNQHLFNNPTFILEAVFLFLVHEIPVFPL